MNPFVFSEFFSVIVVFLILTATIVVLFHLNNHLDKADEIPQDVIMESNNNKEVTENKRIHRKSSFKTRKEAGTNTTFHSQDDEIKAAKFKAKYQELSQSHDNLVREYSLLKNELEVKFKDD